MFVHLLVAMLLQCTFLVIHCNDNCSGKIGKFKDIVASLQQELDDINLANNLNKEKNGLANVVLFHAVKQTGRQSVRDKEVIIFESVKENLGDAYNKNTGVFTAPYKGIYLFSAQVSTSLHTYIHIALVKNGELISRGWGNQDVGTIVQPLKLNAKDKVWIWHDRLNEEYVYPNYTHFTGTLLHGL